MITIELPFKVKRPILACGADIKGAFAFAKGRKAYLFDGFGDLADADNLQRYGRAVKAAVKRLRINPKIVACDLHPGYFSSRFAESFQLSAFSYQPYRVQHHEAHVAAAIVDNAIRGDVIGVAFDGTGYGRDGNIWGGEFFTGNLRSFERAAHFEYVPMPGGEACIRQPWRMAASYLCRAFGEKFLDLKIDFVKSIDKKRWLILNKMIERGLNSPLTSSAGRLFDTAACIILSRKEAKFEAELPIRLEEATDPSVRGRYAFDVKTSGGELVIDSKKISRGIVKDLLSKTDAFAAAGKFHNTMAYVIQKTAARLRKRFGINNVVLSGGVFQNRFLTEKAFDMLRESGFCVHVHSAVPVNDGGIPIGQVAIANGRIK